jgi:radical SAM protein with 4Fe4S-binding SPASM domain
MKFCSAPWDTVTVNPDGAVHACWCGAYNSAGTIGNILETSLVDIMRSSRLQLFQSTVLDQSFSMCNDVCPKKWNLDTVSVAPTFTQYLPTHLLLSVDRECNLRCPSCRVDRLWTGQINPVSMKMLNAITDAYHDHPGTVTLQCDGSGDVFASAAWGSFLSRAALPACFRFHFITNGNLIVKKIDLIATLQDRITSVDVSLDAARADTYTAVRTGKLSVVLAGMRALLGMGIRVNVSFVVQQKNYREMLECWQMVSEMGCYSINFQGIRQWEHHSTAWWQENRLHANPRVDMEYLKDALRQLSGSPTTVSLHGEGRLCPAHMNGDMLSILQ